MPTPARSATAETGASAPRALNTSRAASSTTRSLRRASAWRPWTESGRSEREVTGSAYLYSERNVPVRYRESEEIAPFKFGRRGRACGGNAGVRARSEEHTSEL